jgi:hypothetical protein
MSRRLFLLGCGRGPNRSGVFSTGSRSGPMGLAFFLLGCGRGPNGFGVFSTGRVHGPNRFSVFSTGARMFLVGHRPRPNGFKVFLLGRQVFLPGRRPEPMGFGVSSTSQPGPTRAPFPQVTSPAGPSAPACAAPGSRRFPRPAGVPRLGGDRSAESLDRGASPCALATALREELPLSVPRQVPAGVSRQLPGGLGLST